MGSKLAISTGDAFDVKVQPVVEKRETIPTAEWEKFARYKITYPDGAVKEVVAERPKTYWRTQMRYIVTNARSQPVTVDVVQGGLGQWWWWRDLRVPSESLPGIQDSADQRRWERAGVVFGWVFASHMVGAGISAWVAGFVRDTTGTYDLAWWSAGVLCLLAAAASWLVPRVKNEPLVGWVPGSVR